MKRGGHGRCRRGALAARHALSVLSGLFNAKANGGGIAFFAHVGGVIFGLPITRLLVPAGEITPQSRYARSPLPSQEECLATRRTGKRPRQPRASPPGGD